MQSVQADITSVTFVAISKDSGTDHANTEADECDGTFSGQEFPDKKSAAFGAISKDAGTENASLEDDASAGTGLAPDLPDEHCATLSETDGSVTEPIVRNEEPLPDGWWFIPPNVSLEQYLAAGVASDTTRTKTQKSKKKRKAHTGATHANDSTAPQADLLPGTASATKANDDIEPQADASQETAANAECEQTIPLTTVAPNLEAAGTVIASLLERFPQEFANFNAKLWEFYGANVAKGNSIGLKQDIRWMLNDLLSKQLPKSELFIVGSTVNGCGSTNSDLDMCLVAEDADGGHPSDKQYVMNTLSVVKHTLISDYRKRFRNVKLIPNATVPIITFDVHLPGFVVHVDINVNQLFDIRNSSLLLLYAKIDRRFSVLCVLVRQWAKMKGIGNARCGGLNSYTLNLMVLHYFVYASDPPVLPNLQKVYPRLGDVSTKLCAVNKSKLPKGLKWKSQNKKTLGELLLGFFDYFAHFDFAAYGISTAEGYPTERDKFTSTMQMYNIIVMDPFEPVNAARTVFKKSCPFVLDAFRSFVLDVFGESVLHPPCDSLNDAGDLERAPNDDRQEAEHLLKSDQGSAESEVIEEGHDPSDVRANESEMIVHHKNGQLPNDAGELDTAEEANDDQQEAEQCVKSDRAILESQVAEESEHHSDVRADDSEMIAHEENVELRNDIGELETAQEAYYQQEAEHSVKSILGIVVANENHQPSNVRANGSETSLHKVDRGGEEECAPANLADGTSRGQQQSPGALPGDAKESPSAAVRPKKARRSRLRKLGTHCWCL
ncbi:PAP/25A associated domain containing protein [Aphelenchoides avenae]|nr:PAP/25A associated domain containing protein [Aphelenchus avenae]